MAHESIIEALKHFSPTLLRKSVPRTMRELSFWLSRRPGLTISLFFSAMFALRTSIHLHAEANVLDETQSLIVLLAMGVVLAAAVFCPPAMAVEERKRAVKVAGELNACLEQGFSGHEVDPDTACEMILESLERENNEVFIISWNLAYLWADQDQDFLESCTDELRTSLKNISEHSPKLRSALESRPALLHLCIPDIKSRQFGIVLEERGVREQTDCLRMAVKRGVRCAKQTKKSRRKLSRSTKSKPRRDTVVSYCCNPVRGRVIATDNLVVFQPYNKERLGVQEQAFVVEADSESSLLFRTLRRAVRAYCHAQER